MLSCERKKTLVPNTASIEAKRWHPMNADVHIQSSKNTGRVKTLQKEMEHITLQHHARIVGDSIHQRPITRLIETPTLMLGPPPIHNHWSDFSVTFTNQILATTLKPSRWNLCRRLDSQISHTHNALPYIVEAMSNVVVEYHGLFLFREFSDTWLGQDGMGAFEGSVVPCSEHCLKI